MTKRNLRNNSISRPRQPSRYCQALQRLPHQILLVVLRLTGRIDATETGPAKGKRRGTLPFAKIQKLMANMMLSCIGELTIDPLDVFYVYIPQNLIESMCYLDVIFLKSFIFVGYCIPHSSIRGWSYIPRI